MADRGDGGTNPGYEATQPFRSIVTHAADCVLVVDSEGVVRFANPAAADLFGRTLSELLGSKLGQPIVGGDSTELEVLRKDGSLVTTELRAAPVTWEGAPAVVAALRDISERKRGEDALRKSEAQLKLAQRVAHIGHWELKTYDGTPSWSDEVFQIFGLDPEAGEPSFADHEPLIHPEDWPGFAEAVRVGLETGQPCDLVLRLVRADHQPRWMQVKGNATRDARGNIVKLFGTKQDVTELKRLEAQLIQSDRLSNMGTLAAGIAHEINNPLQYILYNLESLSEDLPRYGGQIARARAALADHLGEDRLREILGTYAEALDPGVVSEMQDRFSDSLCGTRRIQVIARNLGALARVDQDKVTAVDLRGPFESAINIAFNEIKYRARVVKDFQTDSAVLASEGKLAQVFLNLLINAAHAIPEGDVENNLIRIRTWQDGNEVVAEVKDTGSGVPAEALEHIFEPFYTTKPLGIGTGLGLSIAKRIVTGYGGTIDATSEVGRGTRFVMRLPLAQSRGAGAEPVLCHEPSATSDAGRVLVIDDEAGIRRVLKRALRKHEVVEAPSGETGLEILSKDQQFDVILCDLMMPKVSGVDVHKRLVERYPQLAAKLIFVSGGAFTPNAREYLETVSNLQVEKPFSAKVLQKLVAARVAAARAA